MKDFYFLTHGNFNPYFNIASEQFLLKNKTENFIYLWKNSPAVIVGVNQNALEEVNLKFTQENNIKVVRRLTGGGAVYHDFNNICFTIITSYDGSLDAYNHFVTPVIEYLTKLGVRAEFSGRNDITVDGKKISGMAKSVVGDRLLLHGTLLFDTDFTALEGALKPNKLKLESKGIKSVRARVGNIKNHLKGEYANFTADDFFAGLCAHLGNNLPKYQFSESDLLEIEKLAKEKYSTYEWNIGSSPKGTANFTARFNFGTFNFNFNTEKGKICDAKIYGDFFSIKPIEQFSDLFNGVNFDKNSLQPIFDRAGEFISGADGTLICQKFFE